MAQVTGQLIKCKGCRLQQYNMMFITLRTSSTANQVSVSDPYYLPELLAYNALTLVGTKIDKVKVRNRRFSELTEEEKAGFIRFIKNTNPKCEIFTSKEMHTFARQLLNMCFQSYQKRRYIEIIRSSKFQVVTSLHKPRMIHQSVFHPREENSCRSTRTHHHCLDFFQGLQHIFFQSKWRI